MNYLKSFLVLVSFLTFASSLQTARAATTQNSDNIVVLISVDGLAAFYLDDPKAEMPNIRALANQGARAESMKASAPSVTWPNHTTLVTGVTPAIHGVLGNNYFDRAARQKRTLIWDPVFDKDQIVKVPTIYDMAKSNGMKTAAMRWPASRNAATLDWTMPDMKSGPTEKKYTTPSLIEECLQDPALKEGMQFATDNASETKRDEACVNIFNFIVRKHRPQFAMLHLVDVDHTQHSAGPRSAAAYEAIKVADAQVGSVWGELKREFPGKATIVLVSDHGFSPIQRTVLPNVVLRQAGLIKDKAKDNPIQTVSQAGSAMIYILDETHRDALVKKVTKVLRGVKEIASIAGPDQLKIYGLPTPQEDPNAPDMMIFAKEGYVFGDTSSGEIPFQDKPERHGSHGHDPALPDLHATFVAWGAGIKTGAKLGEIDNTRVAPTLAKLLQISMPESVKSTPLSTILAE